MMDLAKFIAERLDEDEQTAEDIHSRDCDTMNPPGFPCDCRMPARELREVEAKRKILAEHPQERCGGRTTHKDDVGCTLCHDDDGNQWYPGHCATVRALAAVYEGHPDFDPAWKEAPAAAGRDWV
jgi:hypothetical protein